MDQKLDYGGCSPKINKLNMEGQHEEIEFTVQGVMTPVPAASDVLASHASSLSIDCETTSTGVGALAPVVVDITSAHLAFGKNKEEVEVVPREGSKQSQPLNTGGKSDSESSNDSNHNITVLSYPDTGVVNKMVDEVSEGLSKLTTTKKRLSGAQRRKLKKLHQKGLIGKGQDAPKEKSETPTTSAEAGKRVRSPEEQNIARSPKRKMSFPPSGDSMKPNRTPILGAPCGSPKKEDGKVEPVTGKARTSAKSSATTGTSNKKPQSTRKRKLDVTKGQEPPSYAKVARRKLRDELCYAVIDTKAPSGKIPEDQQEMVEELINTKIEDYILETANRPPIEIISCEFERGVLMLKIASQQCIEVLTKLVDGIPPPWTGCKLELVKKKNIPALTKTSLFIKGWGSKYSSERIFQILGRQNAKLAVEKWEVFHRKDSPEGSLLVLGIDQDSMASLIENKGMAFFVSKAVFFKIGKTPIGRAVPSSSANINATMAPATGEPQREESRTQQEAAVLSNSQEDKLLEDQ